MIRTVLSAFVFCLLATAATAQECVMPTPPTVPDGSVATEAEMVSGFEGVKTFQAEAAAYRDCMDDEMEATRVSFDNATGSRKKEYEAKFEEMSRSYNASIEAEEDLASDFNAQLGIYRANNP